MRWVLTLPVLVLVVAGCAGEDPESDPGGTDGLSEWSRPPVSTTSSSRPESAEPDGVERSDGPESPASHTPVSRVFDAESVQDSVMSVLTGSYGIEEVDGVSCPPDQPVREGTTFDCTAVIDGADRRVPITVVSDEGRYEVAQPL